MHVSVLELVVAAAMLIDLAWGIARGLICGSPPRPAPESRAFRGIYVRDDADYDRTDRMWTDN